LIIAVQFDRGDMNRRSSWKNL